MCASFKTRPKFSKQFLASWLKSDRNAEFSGPFPAERRRTACPPPICPDYRACQRRPIPCRPEFCRISSTQKRARGKLQASSQPIWRCEVPPFLERKSSCSQTFFLWSRGVFVCICPRQRSHLRVGKRGRRSFASACPCRWRACPEQKPATAVQDTVRFVSLGLARRSDNRRGRGKKHMPRCRVLGHLHK